MSDWFLMQPADEPLEPARQVFITGAPGRIGSNFAKACHERYELTLMAAPEEDASHIEACGRVVRADLTDKDQLVELMRGHDAVVHLAATPKRNASWDALLEPNVTGCHNAFAAAHEAGVRRVVYASSVNAVCGAAADHQIQPSEPTVPANLYGAAKVFGEALARYYAQCEGMACYPLRIGSYQIPERMGRQFETPTVGKVSWRDVNQLIRLCLDTTTVRFAIVHGESRNDHNRMDTTRQRELLGYEPMDDFRTV